MKLSVIICSHNPRADYLSRTLDGLKAQTLPIDQWELLLIDNASKEPLAGQWDLSWHRNARHIREEEVGLTPARLCGIKESSGELLIFVDDDNVMAPDYLAVMQNLAFEHIKLGCFGAGVLEPEFEQEPADELKPYVGGLALRSVTKAQWSNIPTDDITPWGAGLAVRRSVAERFAAVVQNCPIRKQLGRSGSTLNSGEDDEFSWIACEMGYGKGLFPSLKITHLIARRRVEKNYLLAITQGHAFSHTFLAHLHGQPTYLPPAISKFSDILGGLFRAKLSMTLYHANSWWRGRHELVMKKAFDQAWRDGVAQALNKLKTFDRKNN